MRERPNMRGSRNTPTTALQPAILVKIHVHTHAHTHTQCSPLKLSKPQTAYVVQETAKKKERKNKKSLNGRFKFHRGVSVVGKKWKLTA
jgi:hypothetical protein